MNQIHHLNYTVLALSDGDGPKTPSAIILDLNDIGGLLPIISFSPTPYGNLILTGADGLKRCFGELGTALPKPLFNAATLAQEGLMVAVFNDQGPVDEFFLTPNILKLEG